MGSPGGCVLRCGVLRARSLPGASPGNQRSRASCCGGGAPGGKRGPAPVRASSVGYLGARRAAERQRAPRPAQAADASEPSSPKAPIGRRSEKAAPPRGSGGAALGGAALRRRAPQAGRRASSHAAGVGWRQPLRSGRAGGCARLAAKRLRRLGGWRWKQLPYPQLAAAAQRRALPFWRQAARSALRRRESGVGAKVRLLPTQPVGALGVAAPHPGGGRRRPG